MTGPPDIRVSLFAKAMSFPLLMASMVGFSPAAPTIPVTTVSAVSTVAAASMPSDPHSISGIPPLNFSPPSFAALSRSLTSPAASSVPMLTTLGPYFMTCSAINSAFVPADRASMTKLSGHASTISRV